MVIFKAPSVLLYSSRLLSTREKVSSETATVFSVFSRATSLSAFPTLNSASRRLISSTAAETAVSASSPEHPLASLPAVRLEDTLPYRQIIFKKRSGLRQIIDGLFAQIGQMPEVSYEIDEDQVAAGFVSNGFGICVAPDIPLLQSLNVKILPLVSPAWQRNFYMAMLKDVYHPPVVEAFKSYVIEQTKKDWSYRTS